MNKLRLAVVGVGHLGQHRETRSAPPPSGEREGAPSGAPVCGLPIA